VISDVVRDSASNFHEWKHRYYTWEPGTWRRLPGVITGPVQGPVAVRDLNDDLFVIEHDLGALVCRPGRADPLARLDFNPDYGIVRGITFLDAVAKVFDLRTGQRLLPPPYRQFHPDLTRFAPAGRFVAYYVYWLSGGGLDHGTGKFCLTDPLTDKQLITPA
jgi:hypothetical protein